MCFICGLEIRLDWSCEFIEVEPGMVESMFTASSNSRISRRTTRRNHRIHNRWDQREGFNGPAEHPRFMFTAKLEVIYRKNVPIGKPLRLVGKAGQDKGRSAVSWAGIYDVESGELLAEGKFSVSQCASRQTESCQPFWDGMEGLSREVNQDRIIWKVNHERWVRKYFFSISQLFRSRLFPVLKTKIFIGKVRSPRFLIAS